MLVDGMPSAIVGVMPKDFAFPDRETRAWTRFWVAPVFAKDGLRRTMIFSALARLNPGASAAQASAEGTARARGGPDPGLGAVALFGGNGLVEITATPALEQMTADVRPALLLLFAAVGLLLAVAAASIVSVACGLLPALHARRVNLVEALADGRAPVGAGLRSRTAAIRMLIMAGQLAVSCILLVGAALLARSFVAQQHAD